MDGAFPTGGENFTGITVDSQNKSYSSVDGVMFTKRGTWLVAFPAGRRGSYTIPQGTTSIDAWAFYRSRLTTVTIPSTLTHISEMAFAGSQITSLTIPSSVTFIGPSAFYACKNLTSLTIPSSVTQIGWDAFAGCDNLKTITVSRKTDIRSKIPEKAKLIYSD